MPHKVLRRSHAVEDMPVARAVGERIREERHRARLTQEQLAAGRYTKAYISALENGHTKPSLAALGFIATKLGLAIGAFLGDTDPEWTRLAADLALASGEWQQAADAYLSLLDQQRHPVQGAELLRGRAEALYRMERPSEALAAGSEAAAAFDAAGQAADAASARYWVAAAQYQLENDAEARSLFGALLTSVRGGLAVEPEFEARLLIALAAVHSRSQEPRQALAYLGEARAVLDRLDDRRRAAYLATLATGYREGGDTEAAVRTANQAIARFRDLQADADVAILENELALSHLAIRAFRRAREHARTAAAILRRLGDDWALAHVLETEAQIELAAANASTAADQALEAMTVADGTGNRKAGVSARLTLARARRSNGDSEGAAAAYEEAAKLARAHDRRSQLREVLSDWADLRASLGDAAGAYALSREALELTRT